MCEFEFVVEPDRIPRALREIAVIEAHSWKALDGSSLTARPWETRFYDVLAEKFGQREQVLISLLRLDGAPIAYDLSLIGGNRTFCLKTSFDSRYQELSPGLVLREALTRL